MMSAVCGRGCGIVAIGRCASCNEGFCLTHQARRFSVVYVDQCTYCAAASEDAKRNAADAERKAAVARIRSVGDPYARLAMTMALLVQYGSDGTAHHTKAYLPDLCPEFISGGWRDSFTMLDYRYSWTSAGIAAWFANMATARRVSPTGIFRYERRYRSILGGKYRPATRQGWQFHGGSTVQSGSEFFPAWVFVDGTFALTAVPEDVFSASGPGLSHSFRLVALASMAGALGLI